MTTTAPAPVKPRQMFLDDYVPLLGSAEIGELRAMGGLLRDAGVLMVNSTAVGGGVAEILNRLVARGPK